MTSTGPCCPAVRPLRPIGILCAAFVMPWAAMGCARPGLVSGGPVPTSPLTVVGSDPEPGVTVQPFDGPVRIRFQRTVAERPSQGSPNDAVIVSPRTGPTEVRVRGERIDIRMEGGFGAGVLYRVTVLPRFRDRYGNAMAQAFDLFFSTGPPIEPTLLAGVALDRLTMRRMGGVRVDATPSSGGPVLSTAADSTGIFTFPHIPAGEYELSLYEDLNRSGGPDGVEPRATDELTIAVGDTIVLTDLVLLAPDETAAVLQSVSRNDSVTVRLRFDDYLNPVASLDGVDVSLVPDPNDPAAAGLTEPGIAEILHGWEWIARNPPGVGPTGGGQVGPGQVAPGQVGPGQVSTGPAGAAAAGVPPLQGAPLPSRDLFLLLSQPLVENVRYRVTVGGIVNVNGVSEGQGEAFLPG